MTIRVNHGVRMAVVLCALGASASAGPNDHAAHSAAAEKPAGAAATPTKAESKADKAEAEHGKDDHGKDKEEKGNRGKGEDRDKGAKADDDDKGRPEAPPGLEGKDDEHHKKLLERFEERRKTAPDRAKQERAEIRAKWARFLDKPEAQQELRRHAVTVARLERIKDIAEVAGKAELSARVSVALDHEKARHEKGMAALAGSVTAPVAAASGVTP